MHQHRVVRVVGRSQGVDTVHQKNQVGPPGGLRRQLQLAQRPPRRVVVANGHGHLGQRCEKAQPLIAHHRMLLRPCPIEIGHEMLVSLRGRHPDVVQHAELEQVVDIDRAAPGGPTTFGGHDAHPLAVGHVVHPDQVQGIRQGINNVMKVNAQSHGRVLGRSHARCFSAQETVI